MTVNILPKDSLGDWINHLSEAYRLIGPQKVGDNHVFSEVKSKSEIDLNYLSTLLPPKKALMPQQEDLIRFNRSTGQIKPVLDEIPTVLLGVHACDLAGIQLLDQVFSQGFIDQHYLSRRENITLVSIECLSICSEFAFCKDMGTLSLPEKFDLHLTEIGDAYMVHTGSNKGEKLLEDFHQIQSCQEKDCRNYQHVMSNKWANFPFRLNLDISSLPSLMKLSAKSMLWEDIDKRCLGCGTCTIVCPTCYCFDILDEPDFTMESGRRFRVWDSCQLNLFARVAGGHDFRSTRAARQRHRFNRKYSYQSIGPGMLACVGCGRCAMNCLVNIAPVDVLNKLNQQQVAIKPRQMMVTG